MVSTRVKYRDLQGQERVISYENYRRFCNDLEVIEVWEEDQ